MTLFLDANVLFAATISPQGTSRGLFKLTEQGYCRLVASPYVLTEVRRNISRKYPRHSDELEVLLAGLMVTQEASQALVEWAAAYLPDKDAPVLAAAVTAEADLLVTGDKTHFGSLYGQTLRGVEVTTITDAMARSLS